MYVIDKTNGSKVVATALGDGADGEIIAFNPQDNFFYHWSGNSTVVYQRILSVAPYTVTTIPIIGSTNGETFGAVWDGCRQRFIGSNIGSRFNIWNPDGTVSVAMGSAPDDMRGLALVGGTTCNVNLTVAISAVPAVPVTGNPVTLTVTVRNNGPARALTPSVALSIAANITGISTTNCSAYPTCNLPTIFTDDTATITISGTFGPGAGTSTATATTTSVETAPPDNTASIRLGGSIDVTPTSGLVTTEAGGTATYSVVLSSQPTANVTVPVSSNDTTEGTPSVSSLVFTTSDWNAPHVVTVTGVNDFVIDGAIAYSIINGAATSADLNYNNLDPADVAVTNSDNDVAGITLTPPVSPVTTEAGGTATFSMVLTAQPASDVSVSLTSSDTTEGTLSAASAIFTSVDWNTPHVITVTGADDTPVDGNIAYTIVTGASVSSDSNFNGLNPPDVALTNSDNDTAGLTINDVGVVEGTGSNPQVTFTVTSSNAVVGGFTVPYGSVDGSATAPGDYNIAGGTLTFVGNAGETQTLQVTVIGDSAPEPTETFGVNLGPASNPGVVLTDGQGTATITDDDVADLSITLDDAPDPVTAGTNLTYTAIVSNAGPATATGVTVTLPLPLPPGTSLSSGSVSGGGSCAGAPVVCTVSGSVAPGSPRTVTIILAVASSVPSGTLLNATATVDSPLPDQTPGNDSASTTTSVLSSADLVLSFAASATEALVNVPVTFTAASQNLGPSDAQNVVVTITLTPDFRYAGHTPSAGAVCVTPQVGTTGSIVCTWSGATAANATRSLQVLAYGVVGGTIRVDASTSSSTPDPLPDNNASSASVVVGFLVEAIPMANGHGLILLGLMFSLLGLVAVRRQS